MGTHWDTTALPILEHVASEAIAGRTRLSTEKISDSTGIDLEQVQQAIVWLDQDNLIQSRKVNGPPIGVDRVNPAGLRAAGHWPSSNNEAFGNAMVEALEKLAAGERDEEKSAALQAAASDLRSIGVNGAGQMLGSLLKGIVGLA